MITILRRVARLAFRKGMGGGNRVWLALGVLSWFAARAREKSNQPPALYTETLKPGEAISVRILEPER